MAKLTKAQIWALRVLAQRGDVSPSQLGQEMMERPGVIRRGGNQDSAQGLGRIGGVMGWRLVKMGFAGTGQRSWPGGITQSYGYHITEPGRRALAEADGGE